MGLTGFLSNLIGNNYLATIFVSIFPLIELKGGIVFARGVGFGFFESFGLAYLGSTFAFIPIFFLLVPILKLLKKMKWFNSFACKIENYIKDKADETVKKPNKNGIIKSETAIKQLAVFIFVAIPLPMTGVWMGTAIAVFLGMKFKDAVLPVVFGNFIAGAIISLLAQICIWFWTINVLDYILYGLLALAVILLIITLIKIFTKKKEKEN